MFIVFESHIVPEYSFLDARGLGAYEGKASQSVSEVSFMYSVYSCKDSIFDSFCSKPTKIPNTIRLEPV